MQHIFKHPKRNITRGRKYACPTVVEYSGKIGLSQTKAHYKVHSRTLTTLSNRKDLAYLLPEHQCGSESQDDNQTVAQLEMGSEAGTNKDDVIITKNNGSHHLYSTCDAERSWTAP